MKPRKKIYYIKAKIDVYLIEHSIEWGVTPYVYYEVETPEKSYFTKEYFTALKQFNQIINP